MILTWYRRLANVKMSRRFRSQYLAARSTACRPRLETFEDRVAPATHTWSGAVSQLWSDSRNWREGTTPYGDSLADLVFPSSGVSNFTSQDDHGGNTNIDSIQFNGSGFIVNYKPGSPASLTLFGQIYDNAPGTNYISLDVGLDSFGSDHQTHLLVVVGGTLVMSGTIGDAGTSQLAKDGNGSVQLLAANTYTGATHINVGTLDAGVNNAVPAGSRVLVSVGGVFNVCAANDTIGSLADGMGGGGAVVLGCSLGGGSLSTGVDGTSTTYSGVISGSGTLTKDGLGTFTLANHNSYQGATTVRAGTLQLKYADGMGPATVATVNSPGTLLLPNADNDVGSLAGNGTVTGFIGANLTVGDNNASTEFNGSITSITTLKKVGTGTLTLSGNNNYKALTISSGTVRVGASGAVSASCVVALGSGGTLNVNNVSITIGSLADNGGAGNVILGTQSSVQLTTGGLNLSTSFSGSISGAGGLKKVGTGTFTLFGHNTYSGTTVIAGGTLQLGADNATSSQSEVFLQGGTFDVNGHADSIGPLIGAGGTLVTLGNGGSLTTGGLAGNGGINLGNGALSVSDYAFDTWQYAGVISGNGSLYKTGNSTQELDGNNTYTGSTTVVGGGTLLVNGSLSPSSGILVNGAALSGTGTVGRFGTLGSAVIAPGGFNAGTLTAGDGTFLGGSTLRVRLNGTSAYDRLASTGTVDLSNHPNLTVALNFASTGGEQFTVVTASGSIIGTFSGLAEGQVFAAGNARFQIHYTANSIVLTHVADAATHLIVSAPSTSQAGNPFDVTVTAADAGGHPDPLYTGTVHFTSQDPYGAMLPSDYTFTSTDQGLHTFCGGATLFTAGNWDVTVTDTISGITGNVNVLITPAPAASFVLSAPATASSGSPFDITVTAVDPYGNTDTNYHGTVTFTTSDPDPGVVLPANYTFQPGDQGSVTFAGGVTLITPGDQTITVSDTSSGISGNATVTVTSGPLSHDDGYRSLALLSLPPVPTEPSGVCHATPTSAETAPCDPTQSSVAVLEMNAWKTIFGASVLARGGPLGEPVAQAIDLVFLEAES
jgi:autotransporter-associated beta strand protein